MDSGSPFGTDGDITVSQQRLHMFEGQINKLVSYLEGPGGLWVRLERIDERSRSEQKEITEIKDSLHRETAEIKSSLQKETKEIKDSLRDINASISGENGISNKVAALEKDSSHMASRAWVLGGVLVGIVAAITAMKLLFGAPDVVVNIDPSAVSKEVVSLLQKPNPQE